MRKVLVTAIAAIALLGLTTVDLSACGKKASETKSASATSSGCGSKTADVSAKLVNSKGADAKLTGSKSGCAHGKKAGATTASSYAKECTIDGKSCNVATLSVSGMTCGGCEKSVSAALADVPGVIKVGDVSFESGQATVYYDPAKVKSDALTSAVANKGYKAEVIPAVARTTDSEAAATLTKEGSGCPYSKHAEKEVKAEKAAGSK